jgi:hypothetical protein
MRNSNTEKHHDFFVHLSCCATIQIHTSKNFCQHNISYQPLTKPQVSGVAVNHHQAYMNSIQKIITIKQKEWYCN